MFWLTTKQLNRVWVATDEKRDQFVKTIDRGICCFIDALLEVGKAKNFIGGVQGTATNVDIRAFDVRAVSVGTAKSEENDALAEMRVCIKKFIWLLQLPFINTGLMVNELVNLDYEATNNLIRVHEKPGARKDRYSSVSYNYYIAMQVERSMAKNYAKTKKIEINFRAPARRRGTFDY